MEEVTHRLAQLGVSQLTPYPNCNPDINPVDVYRSHITDALAEITGADKSVIYPALAWSNSPDRGDLVLAVPALRLKGKKPADVTAEIVEKFPDSPLLGKPTAANVFLQFNFKPEALTQLIIPSILKKKSAYGLNPRIGLKDASDPSKGKKKIIVEFSSPNIAKPFHAGHLRSTIIGGFLSNLYERAGWDVTRMNYLGDWGTQFGLLALAWHMYGNEEQLVENPIGHLYDIYVEINKLHRPEHEMINEMKKQGEDVTEIYEKSWAKKAQEYFRRMEEGDEEVLALWKKFRDLSIERYKQTYARLNIQYDVYSGESQIKPESMEAAMQMLTEKGLLEDAQGAQIIDLEKYDKKLGKCRVKKADGTTLYLTRDIGAAVERYERFQFDKMIYVVGSQQDVHMGQLFKILELMGRKDISEKCEHVNFGMVLGMSTRRGTVKFLDDILEEVAGKMHEVMRTNAEKYAQVANPDQVADTLGITSVMVQDMTGKRINNYEFNINRMTSFEGDTGPYLQYAHARLCSITRRAGIAHESLYDADLSLLTSVSTSSGPSHSSHAALLVRSLAQWPDVFNNTLKTLEPITVLMYLFKMTHMLSSSYDHLKIVGSEPELARARLALYESARQVLNDGMRLLGLSPVERM